MLGVHATFLELSLLTPLAPDKLAFLDGYLFRVMVGLLKSEGINTSGLYEYYEARIEQERCALSPYDRMLVGYIQDNFELTRQIVHVGSGLGTLTAALAVAGYPVAGVERDAKRYRAAAHMLSALAEAWPVEASRYRLVRGEYPTVFAASPLLTSNTVVVFTNCGATWSDEFTNRVIASFLSCGDVILDTRLFGLVRNSPDERQALLDRIEATGLNAMPIPKGTTDTFYHHIKLGAVPR